MLRVYGQRGGAAGKGREEGGTPGVVSQYHWEEPAGSDAAWAPTWAVLHVHPSTERATRRAPPGAGPDDGGVGNARWSMPRLAANITIHLHHAPGTAEREHHVRIMDGIHRAVDKVVRRTNQKLLLHQLHETRVCSPLLIAPTSSHDMARNGARAIAAERGAASGRAPLLLPQGAGALNSASTGTGGAGAAATTASSRRTAADEKDKERLRAVRTAAAIHMAPDGEVRRFELDEFACPVRHRIRLPLQDRLTYSTALQAVNDVLAPFAARELDLRGDTAGRERYIYVYEDRGGNIFYLILSAMERLAMGDAVLIAGEDKTRQGLDVGEVGTIVQDDHDSRPFTVRRANGELTSCYTESELMRASTEMSSRRPLLELVVLGVAPCSAEVAVDLTSILVGKIAAMSVAVLSGLLLRNPMYPHFQPTDIAFVRPKGAAPAAASRMLLPAPLAAPRCSIRACVLTLNQKLAHFFTPLRLTTAFQAEEGLQLSERLVFEEVVAAGPSAAGGGAAAESGSAAAAAATATRKLHDDDFMTGLGASGASDEAGPLDPRVWHPSMRHYRVMESSLASAVASRASVPPSKAATGASKTSAGAAAAQAWGWEKGGAEADGGGDEVSRRLAALATPVFTGLERIVERRVAIYASAGATIADSPPTPLSGRGGANADVTIATATSRRGAERNASSSTGQLPRQQQPQPRLHSARSGAVRSHSSSNRGGATAANLASSSRRSHGVSVIYLGFQERAPGAFVYAAFTHGFLSHSPPMHPHRPGSAAAAAAAAMTVTAAAATMARGSSPSNTVALKASSEWTPAIRMPLGTPLREIRHGTEACASIPRFDLTACVWCRGAVRRCGNLVRWVEQAVNQLAHEVFAESTLLVEPFARLAPSARDPRLALLNATLQRAHSFGSSAVKVYAWEPALALPSWACELIERDIALRSRSVFSVRGRTSDSATALAAWAVPTPSASSRAPGATMGAAGDSAPWKGFARNGLLGARRTVVLEYAPAGATTGARGVAGSVGTLEPSANGATGGATRTRRRPRSSSVGSERSATLPRKAAAGAASTAAARRSKARARSVAQYGAARLFDQSIVEPRAAGAVASGGGGSRAALLVKHATAVFTITPRRVEVLLYNWTAHARRRLRAQLVMPALASATRQSELLAGLVCHKLGASLSRFPRAGNAPQAVYWSSLWHALPAPRNERGLAAAAWRDGVQNSARRGEFILFSADICANPANNLTCSPPPTFSLLIIKRARDARAALQARRRRARGRHVRVISMTAPLDTNPAHFFDVLPLPSLSDHFISRLTRHDTGASAASQPRVGARGGRDAGGEGSRRTPVVVASAAGRRRFDHAAYYRARFAQPARRGGDEVS